MLPVVAFETEVFAFLQIGEVILIGVCFAFERDIKVSVNVAAILHDAEQPLKEMHHVEEHVAHFPYLRGVNLLMVKRHRIARTFGEKHAKQVDGIEVFPEWYDLVVYYLHIRPKDARPTLGLKPSENRPKPDGGKSHKTK